MRKGRVKCHRESAAVVTRASCGHLFLTACMVTSLLLFPNPEPHHLTSIHGSSFLPGLPASRLSSLQPSLHTIARAQLMQLNPDHTLFMLRNPQQLPTAHRLTLSFPTSLLKTVHSWSKSFHASGYQLHLTIYLGLNMLCTFLPMNHYFPC